MKLRKTVFSAVAMALFMSLSCVSAFADPASEVRPEGSDVLVSTNSTDQNLLSEVKGSGVVVSTNSTDQNPFSLFVTPFAAKATFSYTNLQPNSHTIITSNSFDVYSPGPVTITIVQYPSNGSGTADIRYSLRTSEVADKEVYGNYKSTSNTVTWSYVNPGTYYIGVENIGNVAVSGNGYVN